MHWGIQYSAYINVCGEWGGAESRGHGSRPRPTRNIVIQVNWDIFVLSQQMFSLIWKQ